MELATRARELLAAIAYINLATVSPDGRPWNTPVYAVHDEQLRFYWSSWKEAEHSKNLRTNPAVFFTLYDSTRQRGDNNRRCLYFAGEAVELADAAEIQRGLALLYAEDASEMDAAEFLDEGLRRIYRAMPHAAWLNDKSERQVTRETVKMRVDVALEDLRALAASPGR